jgi:hypothetical protein
LVEAQLALHVLVDAFGAPPLLEDPHHLLGVRVPGIATSEKSVGLDSPSGHSMIRSCSTPPTRTRRRANRERSARALPPRQVTVRKAVFGSDSASLATVTVSRSRPWAPSGVTVVVEWIPTAYGRPSQRWPSSSSRWQGRGSLRFDRAPRAHQVRQRG